ncbi:hypothetical protein CC78DRAFT_208108 [Lojkania enalia]|uniref:Uncharacterized protein n=1 Tax=Lojkania enalia TaxID=147567 RepID=A0A9P4N6U6_9PLEO|nr:hypothetical protein CC78DRAFT_208108 [Didymosphaeria enalia]
MEENENSHNKVTLCNPASVPPFIFFFFFFFFHSTCSNDYSSVVYSLDLLSSGRLLSASHIHESSLFNTRAMGKITNTGLCYLALHWLTN